MSVYVLARSQYTTYSPRTIAGKTNKTNYELYALLGEVYGSGCPLGYLLLQTSDDTAEGGKERYIRDVLKYFRDTWKIRAIFTLTDKDWSEINAFLGIYPEAKHQLCYWHALRAIKKRLAVLRRAPKFYDVAEATREFEWIDENFVPVGQAQKVSEVRDCTSCDERDLHMLSGRLCC